MFQMTGDTSSVNEGNCANCAVVAELSVSEAMNNVGVCSELHGNTSPPPESQTVAAAVAADQEPMKLLPDASTDTVVCAASHAAEKINNESFAASGEIADNHEVVMSESQSVCQDGLMDVSDVRGHTRSVSSLPCCQSPDESVTQVYSKFIFICM